MLPLRDLIDHDDPALPLLRDWAAKALAPVELLPPSPNRDQALLLTQVTTRSPMGAVVHNTGGILVDHGWIRILGSGHDRLPRTLPVWNDGRSDGAFLLVADDAIGGFFALNGGTLGPDLKNLYYFAPDSLDWEPMKIGYSQFLQWTFSGATARFYDWIRWPTWQADVANLHGDRCFFFYPFLFTTEGHAGRGQRREIPVDEAWSLQMDLRRQLNAPDRPQ